MLESIRTAFGVPELRRKILFTVGMLVIYRLAANIPVPGVSLDAWFQFTSGNAGFEGLLGVLDLLSGGAVSNFSVLAMGVYPYITASIIIQLLTPIIPYLQELQEEGEQGRNRMTKITYYLTVPLAVLQAIGQINLVGINFSSAPGQSALQSIMPYWGFTSGFNTLATLTTLLAMVGGTFFAIWLGEQITENGIGQGISLIIFGGIVSGIPTALIRLFTVTESNQTDRIFAILAFVVITLVTTLVIVYIQEGERRIPVQYGRRVRGRKVYQGQSSYIPLKVNTAGMIPIIFASSILTFPALMASIIPGANLPPSPEDSIWLSIAKVFTNFQQGANVEVYPWTVFFYWLATFLFVAGFTFFYTDVMIQQQRIPQSLQQRGGFIPGIRPGRKTAEYVTAVVRRITLVGAVFLGTVAVLPGFMQFLGSWLQITGLFESSLVINGSGLIIIVGVVIDTMRQIEAQLIMRNYEQTIG